MPLIIICGRPASGKTQLSTMLSKVLSVKLGKDCILVNEETLGVSRKESYSDAETEKSLRGLLKSAVERGLSSRGVPVICDSLNYIKGFRYELFCMAKARSSVCCTVFCDVPKEVSIKRNDERFTQKSEDSYGQPLLTELCSRFEPPAATNRWERPLIVYSQELQQLENGFNSIIDQVITAITEAKGPRPNAATMEEKAGKAISVQGMDRITAEVCASLVRSCSDPSFAPGDSIAVPDASIKVCLPRRIGAAELGRLRRQFVKMAETGADELSKVSNPADAFVEWLNNSLSGAS